MATSPGQGSNTGPFGIPPGGPWFVNNASGTIQRQSNPVLAEGLATTGWTGFPTQAAAKAFANKGPAGQIKSVGQSAFSGINAVGDFANKLTQANTWLRIAEGLLGIVLIGVALAKLTGADNAVAKAAVTAAKVVK